MHPQEGPDLRSKTESVLYAEKSLVFLFFAAIVWSLLQNAALVPAALGLPAAPLYRTAVSVPDWQLTVH